ncbi:MAG: cell wall metabolism sensor histidine kinase WalK [Acetobacteraceae bacterium]|nr:cell wall metabolism sensor histidine kinase WalK [Acetobacteraceae bacterium]
MRSIQWKLVLVFTLLILLAMELVGVYLFQSLERYYLRELSSNLVPQAQVLAGLLERYLGGSPSLDQVDELVAQFARLSGVEVTVLDHRGLVLSGSGGGAVLRGEQLVQAEITRALSGSRGEAIRVDPDAGRRRLYLAVPIRSRGAVVGAVYLSASLERVYLTLGDVRVILLGATLLALGVAVTLGFATSRTITGPIREVTSQAAQMAAGDFDRRIAVRSPDEIGKLGEMFNYLAGRLKQTLGEISQEKGKLEAVLTHMADGILAVDRSGRVVLTNPAAASLLGVGEAEIAGRALEDVPAVSALSGPARATLAGETGLTRELRLDGPAPRVLEAHFAPLRWDGEVAGLVIVLHDVTEKERLERLRREFVANVSHELRTPLTTVKSYLETLLDGAADDPALRSRFLEVASQEANRMVRLVSDLLRLSQLDHGVRRWELAPVDVLRVMEGAVGKLELEAKRKRLTVTVGCPRPLPPIPADRDGIEQVFLNILANAVEFTPPGGAISIVLGPVEQGVEVRVSDTGIGIPERDLPRVFERFYRVDKARSRGLGGSGLGLSIAKEIVDAHGGHIGIQSRVGEGTVVKVFLPLSAPPQGRSQPGEGRPCA